ncbi:three-Cys-motif partner protein TcmP [Ferrovibrio xuzhouensis]|uniref:Three-Cys-motif partner protein TcmP n=1 Tax=Ferrovibrio xuzhouensis TaxID=1576914 RepID=A0ABV7VC46_9PROT
MAAQKFGGTWSILKVDAVANYMEKFNTALKYQSFKRIYIDAFAGSGDFSFDATSAPLLDEHEAVRVHEGSARRALAVDPPFTRLIFIDRKPANIRALKSLGTQDERVTIISGDANIEVKQIISKINWEDTRGVIFLDPFGNSVGWETLRAIARTKLDLWYLFPLSGVYRNAPNNHALLTEDKRSTLNFILGTNEWESAFYAAPPVTGAPDLFGYVQPAAGMQRVLNPDGIEAWVKRRLEDEFPLVLPPARILGKTNAPMFSLFFAMANHSKAAQKVGRPIATAVLKNLR